MSTEDDGWKERIGLLTEDERANMETIVEKKLEETRTRVSSWKSDEVELKILCRRTFNDFRFVLQEGQRSSSDQIFL